MSDPSTTPTPQEGSDFKPLKVSVSLSRKMSDGNYGSVEIGVMMEDYVIDPNSRAAVLNNLIEKEAMFIKAKMKEALPEAGNTTKEL